jgi:collagenase-like PrtC family protease
MSIDFIWGANQTTDIESLAKIGIKQVYIGYIGNSSKHYPPNFVLLNRRGAEANFFNKKDLCSFLSRMSNNNITATVTFNGLYTPEQYDCIMEDIEFISKFDVITGIIVNDIGLLLRLKQNKYNKKIIISTGGTIFNSSSIEFYKQFGATEFVIDRQLKYEELISIIEKHKDVNFEIFLLGAECLFVDGFCTFLHFDIKESSFGNFICPCCEIRWNQQNNNFSVYGNKKEQFIFKNGFQACNLCLVNKLKKYKNIKYKLPTRSFNNKRQKKILDKIEYIKNGNMEIKTIFKDIFEIECTNTNCYYSYI